MMDSIAKYRLSWLGSLLASSLLIATWTLNRSPQDASEPSSQNLVRLVQLPTVRGPAFDLSGLTVPAAEIRSGGPPKDGIPALTNPAMIASVNATYLRPSDRVIGVVADSLARAYPLKILNYHEIVIDVTTNETRMPDTLPTHA